MALIRDSQAREMIRDAIVLDLGDVSQQAAKIRSNAEAQAKAILAQAKLDRDKLLSAAESKGKEAGYAVGLAQGLEEGRATGIQQGLEQATQACQKVAASWENALTSFLDERDSIIEQARTQLIDLAVNIAQRLTLQQISFDRDLTARALEEVLPLVAQRSNFTITINPEDRPAVDALLSSPARLLTSTQHASINESSNLPLGTCIINLPNGGTIDASLDTRLDRIVSQLLPTKPTSTPSPDTTTSVPSQPPESQEQPQNQEPLP